MGPRLRCPEAGQSQVGHGPHLGLVDRQDLTLEGGFGTPSTALGANLHAGLTLIGAPVSPPVPLADYMTGIFER